MPKKCKACFMKDCDCTCNTCEAVRMRNKILSQKELDLMNVGDGIMEAIKKNVKNSESSS